jgi:hypothetical protein
MLLSGVMIRTRFNWPRLYFTATFFDWRITISSNSGCAYPKQVQRMFDEY